MRMQKTLILFVVVALALSGCVSATQQAVAPAANVMLIIAPLEGSKVPAGEPLNVTSQIEASIDLNKVELLIDGVVVRTDEFSTPLKHSQVVAPYVPNVPGVYSLQTRAIGSAGQILSQVVHLVVGDPLPTSTIEPSATMTPTVTITLTPGQVFSPTPTQTLTPSKAMATANQNANCRYGPSPAFESSSSLMKGETAEVIGKNYQNTWTLILNGVYGPCWVWNPTINISGSTEGITVVQSPPTPTPTGMAMKIPVQQSPSGGLTCRSTVVLDWNPVIGLPTPISYEWRLNGPGGSKLEGVTSKDHKEVPVACNTEYSWQVRTISGTGEKSPYSGKMEFKIKSP